MLTRHAGDTIILTGRKMPRTPWAEPLASNLRGTFFHPIAEMAHFRWGSGITTIWLRFGSTKAG